MSVLNFITAVIIILWSTFLISVSGYTDSADSPVDRLKANLLRDYRKIHRPVKDYKHNITIGVGLSIKQVNLDDELQILKVSSNLYLSWTDEYLSWDPIDYDKLNLVIFSANEIWTPDIALYNSAPDSEVKPSKDWPIWIKSSGEAVWKPDFTAQVPCQLDLYYWPSDSHTCGLQFGSWAYHGEQVDIIPVKDKSLVLANFEPNGQWRLVKYTSSKKTVAYDDTYLYWYAEITLRRNGAARIKYISHSTLAVLVSVLLAYILPISFHLSRILLHIFGLSILIICDFVLFMAIPNTGGRVPHVVSYFSGTIVLTAISLVANGIMITLYFSSSPQKILRRKISSLLSFTRSRVLSEEVGYMHLTDEVVHINEVRSGLEGPHDQATDNDASETTPVENEEVINSRNDPASHHVNPISMEPYYVGLTVFRTINITLFVVFALAFIIDYSVMTSMITV